MKEYAVSIERIWVYTDIIEANNEVEALRVAYEYSDNPEYWEQIGLDVTNVESINDMGV